MQALFFLRHYNDIHHITPVLHKWVQRGHRCDVVLIGEGHFSNDYRVGYLASLSLVRLVHIDEILGRKQIARMRVHKLVLHRYFRAGAPALVTGVLDKILGPQERNDFWKRIARALLQRNFADDKRGVVVFDWISSNSVLPVEFEQFLVKKPCIEATAYPITK